jgi:hypothetical protein
VKFILHECLELGHCSFPTFGLGLEELFFLDFSLSAFGLEWHYQLFLLSS